MVVAFSSAYASFLVIAFVKYGLVVKFAQVAIALSLLFVCAIQDINKKTITVGTVIVAYILSIILTCFSFGISLLLKQLLYSIITFMMFFAVSYLTKKGIGEGDILILSTLVFVIGPALSFAVFSIASILLICVYIIKGRKSDKTFSEPLVPYLFVSAIPLLLLL